MATGQPPRDEQGERGEQDERGGTAERPPLFRVLRGQPDAAELAALTAVLLVRAAAEGADPDDLSRRHRAAARWARPERERGFEGPRTWRAE
ncbi:acyl-CoA carboxylase subunit epsilon [Streptomyces boncukensis]|uniref:Acyl-CoA carboxylase subunit epsilon n=1 Tax=Streptomyces boncukensis TaxID=2711219 RepID=A0A6G4WWE0_9ACTN|nr:acyl-CoA carboxylase subunit epsilon [Streptomyces boncukensis]NGO68940.1 acyl-CoA carboxylase subunit epsilon [Streptomyces boncukensis]